MPILSFPQMWEQGWGPRCGSQGLCLCPRTHPWGLSVQHVKPHNGGLQLFHPPAVGSADGEASLELLEGSFITGPHIWAKNFRGTQAISFLLDLGPTQDALMPQAAGLCVEEGPSASEKGP